MTREEANKRLNEALNELQLGIQALQEFAEENNLEFSLDIGGLGKPVYFREIRTLEWAASDSCEWETSDEYSYAFGWSEEQYDD